MARFRRSGSPAEQLLETMIAWRAPVRIGLAAAITITVAAAFTLAVSNAERDGETASILGAGTIDADGDEPAGPGTGPGDANTNGSDTTDARVFDNPPVTGDRPQGGVGGSTVVGQSGASASDPPVSETPDPTPTARAGASTSAPTTSAPVVGPLTTPTTAPSTTGSPTVTTAPTTTVIETTTTTTAAPTTTTTSEPATSSSSVPAPPVVVRVEAESGTLLGTAAARSDHDGFSGTGFVGDIFTEGSGVTLTVNAPAAGSTPFTVRYAAGNNGPEGLRTLTVLVNGFSATTAQMAVTPSWSDWSVVAGELNLVEGDNTISLLWSTGDTGWVNLDYIQLN